MPWPPEADSGRTVVEEMGDSGSTLNLYRRLLQVRKGSAALRAGSFTWLAAGGEVLAYRRNHGEDVRLVAVNISDRSSPLDLPRGYWEAEACSSAGGARPGEPYLNGRIELGPDEAVVFRPARADQPGPSEPGE